jgi:acetyl-CoA/propionyl-CoA carboxylase biotin carboxyl carrier protein
MFERVLIANRGEIARRVIRTLRQLGIGAVAVYAPADRHALHVREADIALPIPSYLDIDALMDACATGSAEALHPGYGFLSENPALARACRDRDVAFVGPPPEAVELMGDKLAAKDAAARAGVPVVPSFSEHEAREDKAPFPLLVKAAAGGGGRGMRVVERPEALDGALAAARREAAAGFGDDRVFIERLLPRARHIEVQVMADQHGGVIHLGERECSLQRRHQKVIEESPSPVVDPSLRAELGQQAVAVAGAAGYQGAGTVEFIAAAENPSEHYFLEMNARLQVEHPVTELVTGLDLVELQLRVASGEPLPLRQTDVALDGHAIEARINAEDAERDFLPAAGQVLAYRRPEQARVDDGIERGSVIDTSYDSLLAKVIVHAEDRTHALAALDRALGETAILGVTTTIGYLRHLLATPEVKDGAVDTTLIERLPAFSGQDPLEVAQAAAQVLLALQAEASGDDPFADARGWRPSGTPSRSWWPLALPGGENFEVMLESGRYPWPERYGTDSFLIGEGPDRRRWLYAEDGEVLWLGTGGSAWAVRHAEETAADAAAGDGDLRAPMPGQVLLVPAAVGDEVHAGDTVVVLESMKMELAMTAPVDGRVTELTVAVGDSVVMDQPLARVEAVT